MPHSRASGRGTRRVLAPGGDEQRAGRWEHPGVGGGGDRERAGRRPRPAGARGCEWCGNPAPPWSGNHVATTAHPGAGVGARRLSVLRHRLSRYVLGDTDPGCVPSAHEPGPPDRVCQPRVGDLPGGGPDAARARGRRPRRRPARDRRRAGPDHRSPARPGRPADRGRARRRPRCAARDASRRHQRRGRARRRDRDAVAGRSLQRARSPSRCCTTCRPPISRTGSSPSSRAWSRPEARSCSATACTATRSPTSTSTTRSTRSTPRRLAARLAAAGLTDVTDRRERRAVRRPRPRRRGSRLRPRATVAACCDLAEGLDALGDEAVGRRRHREPSAPSATISARRPPTSSGSPRITIASIIVRKSSSALRRSMSRIASASANSENACSWVGAMHDVQVLAHRDLAAVAAEPLAVRGEHVELARELVGRRREVRLVGVLRDHPQRLLLAARRRSSPGCATTGAGWLIASLHLVVLAVERRPSRRAASAG